MNARPAAIVSVKLISAMPSAAAQSVASSERSGIVSDGKPVGTLPTISTPCDVQAEQRHAPRSPTPTAISGAGSFGANCSTTIKRPAVTDRDEQRQQRRVRHVRDDRQQILEKRVLRKMDAEQLRDLIDDDHDRDAGLEADQHRLGDEVRDEAQPEHRGRDEQDRADEQRQRRGGRSELARVAAGHDAAERRRGQDRDRRRRADAEEARRAEERIDHHRHERGVEADFDRKARDGRVGQAFGSTTAAAVRPAMRSGVNQARSYFASQLQAGKRTIPERPAIV